MAIVNRMYNEFKIVRDGLARAIHRRKFILRDINAQKKALKDYVSDIKEVISGDPLNSDVFCIFIYYEPQDLVSRSVQRALSELREQNVNVILAVNHNLTDAQLAYFKANCYAVILRGNQGFDFGGYKDVIRYMKERRVEPSRLIIMNDSLFFGSAGLREMISRLLGPEDVISSYENWSGAEHHHLQSFCISLSDYVYRSQSFEKFWRDYIPINNRIFAIEQGEKKLSAALLAYARTTHVVFSTSMLHDALLKEEVPFREELFTLPQPWRVWIDQADNSKPYEHLVRMIAELVNSTSPIHAGAYYFPKMLKSPLLKKDLVYRHRFDFWEVERWAPRILSEDEVEEYLTILRKKGDENKLSKTDIAKYRIGAK